MSLATVCNYIASSVYTSYAACPTGYTLNAFSNGLWTLALTPGAAPKKGPGSNGMPSTAFTSQTTAEAVDKHGMPERSQPDNPAGAIVYNKITKMPQAANTQSTTGLIASIPSGGGYASASALSTALQAAAVLVPSTAAQLAGSTPGSHNLPPS
jgi:hypothetical protein